MPRTMATCPGSRVIVVFWSLLSVMLMAPSRRRLAVIPQSRAGPHVPHCGAFAYVGSDTTHAAAGRQGGVGKRGTSIPCPSWLNPVTAFWSSQMAQNAGANQGGGNKTQDKSTDSKRRQENQTGAGTRTRSTFDEHCTPKDLSWPRKLA